MLPLKCGMPDLSDLLVSPADRIFLMHQLIGAEVDFPEQMLAYRRNFVRLADKAARDYTDVRKCVLTLIEQPKLHKLGIAQMRLLMNVIVNKLEDCIITARRLFNYFERVKSNPTGFPLDTLFKRRIKAMEKSIRAVRDLIVHMDEDIYNKVAAGRITAPTLDEKTTTITVGSVTLPVEILARAIRLFHNFASDFARHELLSDGTYRQMPQSGPLKGSRKT